MPPKKTVDTTPEVAAPILPDATPNAPVVAAPVATQKPAVKAPLPPHPSTTRAQEHKAKLVAALAIKFKDLLAKIGVEANPTSDIVEVDGKMFTIHGSSIFVIAPCPKCQLKVARVTPVTAADEVAVVIKSSAPAYHHCEPKPIVEKPVDAPAK